MRPLRPVLAKLPPDLVMLGVFGAVLFAWVVWESKQWGAVDAYLVAVGTLSFSVAITTAILVRMMLRWHARQVEVLGKVVDVLTGPRGDAKGWARGKRLR